jgi:hypothetical protein
MGLDLVERQDDVITIISTALAVDHNMLPVSHEPVGAKRQARDFLPLVRSGQFDTVPDVEALDSTVELFRAEIEGVGLNPDNVVFAIQDTRSEVGDDNDGGLWVTTEPASDDAVYVRIL